MADTKIKCGVLDMKKSLCALLILSILVFSAAGCGFGQPKPVQTEEFALGTIINQQVYGSNAKKAAEEVSARIKEFDALWTINQPGGDINKLNRHAGQGYVKLKPETINILMKARQIADLSGGAAFDITVAPLVKAWGIGTDHPRVISDEEVSRLLTLVNYRDVQINEATGSASLAKTGQMVDLGGIAKGYLGDLAIQIYKKNGITSAFANLGGNVVVLGGKPDGTPWKVGVQNPRSQTGDIVGVVDVIDKAVVTSGDYQRYFVKDGKRYCHIFNPKTGYPADSGLMSVTIIASSSTDADGLSKAYVLGLQKGLDLVKRYGKAEAIFITNDKKIYVTPGLKGKFHLEDVSNEYTCIQIR
ncbi:FAD:protein FMN transferase [Syntrophomonas palmitatica]|uniref:FAD:protein FMN transferase n=1 Tax=Syntrophomonas palmitatica TaxID=402877 RepID=UPI000AE9128B|nr:FAD:protein FMN transferase [Syntrophomonas palmitatica]